MNTADVEEARQEILEATTIDYSLCQLIYRHHPAAKTLINLAIDKAIAAGRDIKIQAAPQMVIDRFHDIFMRYNGDKLAGDLLACAKAYGISSLIIGQYEIETQSPLDLSSLNQYSFINVIDPLNMSGSNVRNQNPNQKNYLQAPKMVRVQGIEYHSSRCFTIYNPFEPTLFMNFNSASLSYAPSSCFERTLPYMKMLLENDNALSAGNRKVGAIVHKKAFMNQSTLDAANMSIKGYIKEKIKNLFNGDAVVVGQGDEISTIDLQHFSQSLQTTREAVLDGIAMASSDGIPAAMLKNALLGRGLSEGDNDKKRENEYIVKHQSTLKPIYSFIDNLIQRIAWNDPDFYRAVQNRHPEYRDVSHRSAIMQWTSSFTWEWNAIDKATPQEESEIAEKKANLSQGVVMLAAQMQLPQETLIDLLATHIENINDNAGLANKFYFDVDMLKLAELEQQLLGETEEAPALTQ